MRVPYTFAAWGPDCERVHDIIDEEDIGPNPPPTMDRVVMTTWHDDKSLAEAIWFVLHNSWPDESYEFRLQLHAGRSDRLCPVGERDPRGFLPASRVLVSRLGQRMRGTPSNKPLKLSAAGSAARTAVLDTSVVGSRAAAA